MGDGLAEEGEIIRSDNGGFSFEATFSSIRLLAKKACSSGSPGQSDRTGQRERRRQRMRSRFWKLTGSGSRLILRTGLMTMWSRVDKQAFPKGRARSDEKSGVLTYSSYVSKSTPPSRSIGRAFAGSDKGGGRTSFFLTQSHDHCSIQFLHADRIGAKGGPEIIIKRNFGFS